LIFRHQLRTETSDLLNPIVVLQNEVALAQSLAMSHRGKYSGAAQERAVAEAASGPLRVSTENPRYFMDGAGQPVYLTGSHTWANFQDNGNGNPPPVFDYGKYLDFLAANNHNFFRLWTWEQSRWTLETADEQYWFNPEGPYVRSNGSQGNALDGKPKWDLTKFDQAYFDRMRQRIITAGERGMYVSIMLFDGWSVVSNQAPALNNPWKGHPYNAQNNINGINGDPNGDNNGSEVHTLATPAVTALQEAYIKKVIDTVNDLDNVLYEIANEAPDNSLPWQTHLVDVIHTYEALKPQQHPVGVTGRYEWSTNDLIATGAEWISPGGEYMWNPPAGDGRAVVIVDTDHLWGIGGDYVWVWKIFTRGLNPIFMDGYDGAAYGVGGQGFNFNNPQWVKLRANMGYTRAYAQQVNLAAMRPRGDLCSTTYCLANPNGPSAEFIVFQPSGANGFTVNLTGLSGSFAVEWLNPESGSKSAGTTVNGGGIVSFTPPYSLAVLYLKQQGGPTPTNTPVPPTNTPGAGTNTPVPPTITPAAGTNTPVPPTSTPTRVPPTVTGTPPTATATALPQALFPTSPLLDNFNRPNGQIGARWGNQPAGFRLVNSRLELLASGVAVWRPGTYGPDQEAFVTFTSLDLTGGSTHEVGLVLKAALAGDALSTGLKAVYAPAAGEVRVAWYDAASGWRPAGAPVKVAFQAGDRFGVQATNDNKVAFFRNGVKVASIAGSFPVSLGGAIGVYAEIAGATMAVVDNFGGGNVSAGPPPAYQLEIQTSTAGQGSVQVMPTGTITCGQFITVTASPKPGWIFGGWTGDIVESANPLVLKISGSLVLVANFIEEVQEAAYSVTVSADGDGLVQVRPPGPYRQGQVVVITAVASSGWLFESWTGSLQGRENPIHLLIGEDYDVTANFARSMDVYLPAISGGWPTQLIGSLESCD
jgi:hypothetical protein